MSIHGASNCTLLPFVYYALVSILVYLKSTIKLVLREGGSGGEVKGAVFIIAEIKGAVTGE